MNLLLFQKSSSIIRLSTKPTHDLIIYINGCALCILSDGERTQVETLCIIGFAFHAESWSIGS